jgi:hypothetical protein
MLQNLPLWSRSAKACSMPARRHWRRHPRVKMRLTKRARDRFTLSATYAVPGIKVPAQLLQGWSISSIVTLQGGLTWYPVDLTNDLTGTGEVNAGAAQTWNYAGERSAFRSGPTSIPCFGPASGCTTAIPQSCVHQYPPQRSFEIVAYCPERNTALTISCHRNTLHVESSENCDSLNR